MRAGILWFQRRSICCTQKYRRKREKRESERKSGSSLNTDLIVAREWKTSTVSFKACTGVTVEGGIEGFLDTVVAPRAAENISSQGYESRTITGANQGPAFSALLLAHGIGCFGGITFSYDGQLAQFYYFNGIYGIRRF